MPSPKSAGPILTENIGDGMPGSGAVRRSLPLVVGAHQIGKQPVGGANISGFAEMHVVGHRQRRILAKPLVHAAGASHGCRPIPKRPTLAQRQAALSGADLGELWRDGPGAVVALCARADAATHVARAFAGPTIAVGRAEDEHRPAARPPGKAADGGAKPRGIVGGVEAVPKAFVGAECDYQQRWSTVGELERDRGRIEPFEQPNRPADTAVVLVDDAAPAPLNRPAEHFGAWRSGCDKVQLMSRLWQQYLRAPHPNLRRSRDDPSRWVLIRPNGQWLAVRAGDELDRDPVEPVRIVAAESHPGVRFGRSGYDRIQTEWRLIVRIGCPQMAPPRFADRDQPRLEVFVWDTGRQPAASGRAEPVLQPLAHAAAERIACRVAVANLHDPDGSARPSLIQRGERRKERPQFLRPDQPRGFGSMAGRQHRPEDQQERRGADQGRAAAAAHRKLAAEVDNSPMIFSAITS